MTAVEGGLLAGKWPGVIDSYDASSRTCIVSIPGITDGAETGLIAEIEYPIGDKSRHGTQTEIEILAGDKVWIEFIQGDPRYPLITGWRNPAVGNSAGWRRWHHQNMQLLADKELKLNSDGTASIQAAQSISMQSQSIAAQADSVSMEASNITLQASGSITLQVGGSSVTLTPDQVKTLAASIIHIEG